MKFFTKYFQFRKMKSLIKQATETIYSEQFDYENIVRKLSSQTNTLQALIAIKYAVYTDEPIEKVDIRQALDEVVSAEQDVEEGREMEIFLGLLKESTEVDWLRRTEAILEGKLANKKNKYSYEAAIYHLESIKKGPATLKEKAKWKTLSNDLEEAKENLKEVEGKIKETAEQESTRKAQAVLDKMIEEMNERRKTMTDEEIQEEIAQARINREEAIKEIKEIAQKNKRS